MSVSSTLQHCVASKRDYFEMAGAQGECNTPQQFIPCALGERELSYRVTSAVSSKLTRYEIRDRRYLCVYPEHPRLY